MGDNIFDEVKRWASTPPDDSFELEALQNEGPQSIKLEKRSHVILGRSKDATVTLMCQTASRMHALLAYHGEHGIVYVHDLKSAHGTWIDGQRIKEHVPTALKLGKELRFGAPEGGARFRVKGVPARKRKAEGGEGDERAKRFAGQTVRCAHVLLKHAGSRRPASDRDPDGKIIKARSKSQAEDQLRGYRADVERGEVEFRDLAKRISECSSYKKGGDLGHFAFGKMEPAFSEAAFNLTVGEVSGPVSTPSGVHIIKRLE